MLDLCFSFPRPNNVKPPIKPNPNKKEGSGTEAEGDVNSADID
jgi:hypothetical protein